MTAFSARQTSNNRHFILKRQLMVENIVDSNMMAGKGENRRSDITTVPIISFHYLSYKLLH